MTRRIWFLAALAAVGSGPVSAQVDWVARIDGPPVDASTDPACKNPSTNRRAIAPAPDGGAFVLGRTLAPTPRPVLLEFAADGSAWSVDVLDPEYAGAAIYAAAPTPGGGVAAIGTRDHWNGTTTEHAAWVAAYEPGGQRRFLTLPELPPTGDTWGSLIAADPGGALFAVAGYRTGATFSSYLFRLTEQGELEWTADLPNVTGADLAVLADGRLALATAGAEPRVLIFSPAGDALGSASVATDPARAESIAHVAAGSGGELAVGGKSCAANVCEALAAVVDANGSTSWSRRVRPSGIGPAIVDDIAVDSAGRIFLAGYQLVTATRGQALVLALSSAGEDLWSDGTIQGTGSSNRARAVTVAPDGAVLVAGHVQDTSEYSDYFVARYQADTGARSWLRILDSGEGRPDEACGITVAPSQSRILVTGSSHRSSPDVWTVAFDAGGSIEWDGFEPPMRPSDQGLGGPAWTTDWGRLALAAGPNGSVAVAGSTSLSDGIHGLGARLARDGHVDWTIEYPAQPGQFPDLRAAALALDGTAYFVGSDGVSGQGYTTIAVGPAGELLWSRVLQGQISSSDANAIAVLPGGDVVVTGRAHIDGNYDAVTVRYDAEGGEVWTRIFDEYSESGVDLAVLPGDEVAVLVQSDVYGPPNKACDVIRYDVAGVERWRTRIVSPGGFAALCLGIGARRHGGFYVTGSAESQSHVVGLDSNGEIEWQLLLGNPGDDSLLRAPAVAGDDALVAAGSVENSGRSSNWIGRVSPSGELLWEQAWMEPYPGSSRFLDVAIGPDERIYGVSLWSGAGSASQLALVSYLPSGQELGSVSSDQILEAHFQYALGVEVTDDGRVVAAATAGTTETANDILVISFPGPELFLDGFETGDTSRWSAAFP